MPDDRPRRPLDYATPSAPPALPPLPEGAVPFAVAAAWFFLLLAFAVVYLLVELFLS